MYTSLHIVGHIQRQSHKYYNKFAAYNLNEKCSKRFIYNLNKLPITCTPTQFIVDKTLRKILTPQNRKMKDLVNGSATAIENGNGLIADQKSTYHNGIGNGDR